MQQNKKIGLVIMLLGTMLVSCSTMTTAEREAKMAEQARYVAKVLGDRHYTIEVSMIYPRRFTPSASTSDWTLEVKGDSLVSYLPYFGVAHEAILGSDTGLNFTAPIESYTDEGFKKGRRTIRLKTSNDDDKLEYHLEVMDNGSATIDVISRKREGISFSGHIAEE